MARVWRRRRSADMPRPAGRRWARLRRSGSRATQVIARVTRRRRSPGPTTGPDLIPQIHRSWRRSRRAADPARAASATLAEPLIVSGAGAVPDPRGWISPPDVRRRPGVTPADDTVPPVPIPLLPGERTPARRAKFVVANACTVGSLLLGMGAVFLALHGDLRLAAVVILACVVLDGCDGALARRFGVVSPFGAQMDSMADLSSFGVATGIVIYQWLLAQGVSPVAAAPVCALIAVSAAIRLARFNVSPKNGRYFSGVPTTMTAAVLALHVLVGPQLPATVQVAAVAAVAVAMVTSFPYAKLGRVLRLPLWLWVFPAICAMISIPGTFAATVAVYVASGPLVWLVHHRRLTLA